jgi:hypothetical protein
MTRARRVLAPAAVVAGAAVACHLVLRIDERPRRPPVAEAAAPDAPVDTGPTAPAERCTKDSDCIPPNGCYTPHCDTVLSACTYALCEESGRSCSIGTCNEATFRCGDYRSYGFRSGTYSVPAVTLGCQTMADGCVAAVFPFLFLGTTSGLVALRIDDLVATAPTRVAIQDLAIEPQQIVASGRRIWIVGQMQGAEPPYRIPLATIAVPSNPLVTEVHGELSLIDYPFPKVTAFPAPGEGVFLALNESAEGLPTAVVHAPLKEQAALGVVNPVDAAPPEVAPAYPMVTVPSPPGSTIVAASGERLLAYRPSSTFNLITKPGVAGASVGPDLTLTPPPTPLLRARFAEGPDGVVTMSEPVAVDAGDCNCTSRQRLQWVLGSGIATVLEANVFVEPESYQNPWDPLQPCGVCNPPDRFATPSLSTWVTAQSALLASPASDPIENRVSTAVRLVRREPVAAPPQQRMATVPSDKPSGDFLVDRIALASTSRFGFLVIADGEGNNVRLSTFDSRCNAP